MNGELEISACAVAKSKLYHPGKTQFQFNTNLWFTIVSIEEDDRHVVMKLTNPEVPGITWTKLYRGEKICIKN